MGSPFDTAGLEWLLRISISLLATFEAFVLEGQAIRTEKRLMF